MSNLQPYYPASKIRVAQKADAFFLGEVGERREREKRMKKKLSLSPKYFSDQKIHPSHL